MEKNIKQLEVPNLWKIFSSGVKTRIVWIASFSVCTLIFIYQSYDRLQLFLDNPKSAFVKLLFAEKLLFPAVTICPGYIFRYSVTKRFKPMDTIGCFPGQKVCKWDFAWNMATVSENIIRECYFQKHWRCSPGLEKRGKWSRFFSSQGRCFTYKSGEYVNCGGDLNALEMSIDPMTWDKSGVLLFSGIRMYLHNDDEIPLIEIHGININEGASASYALELTQYDRINDEKNPCITTANYSRSRCIMNCIHDQTISAAQVYCKAPFMNEIDLKYCDNRKEIGALMTAHDNIINNGSFWNFCSRQCPELCRRVVYTPITSSLGFTQSKNESLIKIKIYFRDMWLQTISEVWDYNFEKLVANVGGSLNLFLGASFITIIQICDVSLFKSLSRLFKFKNSLVTYRQETALEKKIKNGKVPVVW
ncbi:unnamed protein product [Allacma fusca]|uniref:Uncharacterized protein n=1 Tax=Allacma fusca TaxID=39272 RepID=A0A8J2PZH0_9HEXA|nr:unnamed protein product [Allacma fusca]